MSNNNCGVVWFLWPFWALRRLVVGIIALTGRLIGLFLGLALLIIGVIVSLTVVGAILGIPLAIFGFLLMIRSIF